MYKEGSEQQDKPARIEQPEKLSPSSEDYLEAIFLLGGASKAIRSVDLASQMDVSKASVNKAINNLKNAGLVKQPHYGDISLTQEGLFYARKVQSRHETLSRFLIEVLGVESAKAQEEACTMEHAISDETLNRWCEFMDKWHATSDGCSSKAL
ncbi:MAG: metal-dependent transcriptional regulator [Coriobacteriia bacterium]|nr:metal-dependent transcriptional regulator [Coriobacteriia bacterium]